MWLNGVTHGDSRESYSVRTNCSTSISEGEDNSRASPQKTLSFSTITFYGSLHVNLDFGLSEGSFQRVIIDIR